MENAALETSVAVEERVAEEARVVAWLVDGVNDFESLGAGAAAEFGL